MTNSQSGEGEKYVVKLFRNVSFIGSNHVFLDPNTLSPDSGPLLNDCVDYISSQTFFVILFPLITIFFYFR